MSKPYLTSGMDICAYKSNTFFLFQSQMLQVERSPDSEKRKKERGKKNPQESQKFWNLCPSSCHFSNYDLRLQIKCLSLCQSHMPQVERSPDPEKKEEHKKAKNSDIFVYWAAILAIIICTYKSNAFLYFSHKCHKLKGHQNQKKERNTRKQKVMCSWKQVCL